MISANLISNLLDSGFSNDSIRKIIECQYNEAEEKARTEMEWSLANLKNQLTIREIAKSL